MILISSLSSATAFSSMGSPNGKSYLSESESSGKDGLEGGMPSTSDGLEAVSLCLLMRRLLAGRSRRGSIGGRRVKMVLFTFERKYYSASSIDAGCHTV